MPIFSGSILHEESEKQHIPLMVAKMNPFHISSILYYIMLPSNSTKYQGINVPSTENKSKVSLSDTSMINKAILSRVSSLATIYGEIMAEQEWFLFLHRNRKIFKIKCFNTTKRTGYTTICTCHNMSE